MVFTSQDKIKLSVQLFAAVTWQDKVYSPAQELSLYFSHAAGNR
jgi:hypothetical protein